LNPFPFFSAWRRDDTSAAKLYGSIVAQARLPVFYQGVGVPDTLQGRFVVLSLQLFAVLHRLRAEGSAADSLTQDLVDRFGADMETVLREIGIGDLSIPKKVRALAASSGGLLQAYEAALAEGETAIAAVVADTLPVRGGASGAVAGRLAAVAGKSWDELESAHVAEHQRLFRRLRIDLGRTPAADLSTDRRIAANGSTRDPGLVALYVQYGRYLMIASSRPG